MMTSGSRPPSSHATQALALVILNAPDPEDVRSAEGLVRQVLRLLLRNLPRLLDGVVDEHVLGGEEVGPALFRHDLADQRPEKALLQPVPFAVQGNSVAIDELEG